MSSLTVAQRAVGAVVGNLISDAAGMPVHWIYDDDCMREVLAQYPQPEFIPKPYSPFYTIASGRTSDCGDLTYVLLKSLVDCKGFNKEDYTKQILEFFGPDSEYEIKLDHAITKADYPLPGPWRPKCVKALMGEVEQMKIGHGDTFTKVAPMVALYAGSPTLREMVVEMTSVLHKDALSKGCAVAAAALLEHYVLNGPDPAAITTVLATLEGPVVAHMKDALAVLETDHKEVVAQFGKACPVPGSFKNAIHCLGRYEGSFVNTVRETLVACGDNTSRTAFVGSCLGAQLGLAGLPSDWIQKTTMASEFISLSERLVAMRK